MRHGGAQVLTQGLVAGLVGFAAVALFFMIVNLVVGQSPFYTAAALGSALFYGLQDPTQLAIEPGPVLAYNGVHLFLSLVVGTIGAWLVFETERHHFIWYFVFIIFLAGFVYSVTGIGIIAAEINHIVPWWSVVAANVVWVVSVGTYLWLQNRGLIGELIKEQESTP